MPKFVPIQNIDGYISSLRLDGESEDKLAQIREKHLAAMPPKPESKPSEWRLPVKFLDDVMLKLKIVDGYVKVKVTAPLEELMQYTSKPIPIAVTVRCLKRAGAPDDILRMAIEKYNHQRSSEFTKKINKWLDKMNHKTPVKKVLKSVKKKMIPK